MPLQYRNSAYSVRTVVASRLKENGCNIILVNPEAKGILGKPRKAAARAKEAGLLMFRIGAPDVVSGVGIRTTLTALKCPRF